MTITPETSIGEIAATHPAAVPVFQRHRIDFCCGGRQRLAEACAARQIPYELVVRELENALAAPAPVDCDWATQPLERLVGHILTAYHAPLREELPRLQRMAEQVVGAHGERYPAVLPRLVEVFAGLKRELESHMAKEEIVLFPNVIAFEQARREGWPADAAAALAAPIAVMRREHDDAGDLLGELRRLTGDYTPPDDGCPTFQALYRGLAELERALQVHIHLENNILFPRALALGG